MSFSFPAVPVPSRATALVGFAGGMLLLAAVAPIRPSGYQGYLPLMYAFMFTVMAWPKLPRPIPRVFWTGAGLVALAFFAAIKGTSALLSLL